MTLHSERFLYRSLQFAVPNNRAANRSREDNKTFTFHQNLGLFKFDLGSDKLCRLDHVHDHERVPCGRCYNVRSAFQSGPRGDEAEEHLISSRLIVYRYSSFCVVSLKGRKKKNGEKGREGARGPKARRSRAPRGDSVGGGSTSNHSEDADRHRMREGKDAASVTTSNF